MVIFISSFVSLNAQQTKIDSLKFLIENTKTDTAKINLYENLGQAYRDEQKIDSGIFSYKQALQLNEKYNYSLLKQRWELACIDFMLYTTGNYAESLQYALQEMAVTKKTKDNYHLGYVQLVFGHDYKGLGEYRKSLDHYFKAKGFFATYKLSVKEPEVITYTNLCISEVYLKINQPDSALIFAQQAYQSAKADWADQARKNTSIETNYVLYSWRVYGDIYAAKGDHKTALHYYRQYISGFKKYKENNRDLGFVLNNMAKIFQKNNQNDSAGFYAKEALSNATKYKDQQNIYDAANLLYILNDSLKNASQALKYFKIAQAAKDSMASIEKIKQIQLLTFNEQVHEKEQSDAEAKTAARTRLIIIIASILCLLITFLTWNRIRQLRLKYKAILEQKEVEKLKTKHEKEMLELEAKALRAQMNPHFIFNCMNSIKLLIQQQNEEKAINYLTTFSKLIRTIFQNSDKREITLYDEIETCRLYTQLESLRFENKFTYTFSVDETIDLKLLMVPALIIQPFIENAIWHGIMPKDECGCVNIIVKRENENVFCIIDDDGIGRETSSLNKFKTGDSTHQSKGVHLTQSRIDLYNILNQRNGSVEIIDKQNEHGKATGTSVILTFKEY
ncbi:MAG: histidine kinase [Parafilimonas sp.]